MKTVSTLLVVLALSAWQPSEGLSRKQNPDSSRTEEMNLGAFSISLAVKDLKKSHEFYAKLGFKEAGGNAKQNWLILRNGNHTIGLFQGMFEKNIITFNPGWNNQAKNLEEFTDIREIQKQLKAAGLELITEADESTKGPASLTMLDPDGNPVLIDQHR